MIVCSLWFARTGWIRLNTSAIYNTTSFWTANSQSILSRAFAFLKPIMEEIGTVDYNIVNIGTYIVCKI